MARGLLPGYVTERDQELFKFLFESKVATLTQLRERMFPKVSKHTAFRRIRQLARAGWLSRQAHDEHQRLHLAFHLTDLAYRRYVLEPEVNDRKCQLKSDKVMHDVTLVNLRARLEGRPMVVRFFPENLLQSQRDLTTDTNFRDSISLNSDAVLEIKTDEQDHYFIPFEYEASAKSKARWEKKMLDYYLKHDTEVVLWVCKDDAMIGQMSAIDRDLSPGHLPKMYFASLGDVLTGKQELTFLSSKKDKRITL